VPRWYLLVERERLVDWTGQISGPLLKRLVATVEKRIHETGSNP